MGGKKREKTSILSIESYSDFFRELNNLEQIAQDEMHSPYFSIQSSWFYVAIYRISAINRI